MKNELMDFLLADMKHENYPKVWALPPASAQAVGDNENMRKQQSSSTSHHTKHTHKSCIRTIMSYKKYMNLPDTTEQRQNGNSKMCTRGAQKQHKKLLKNYTKTTKNTKKKYKKKTVVDET